jgi:2-dehydropantoate 2-reductase
MRYLVVGAGAIGGVIGGRLFEAGRDVTLVARGPHLNAIRKHGLRLDSPAGTDVLPVAVVGHPADIDWPTGTPVDEAVVVLLAVKSHQTVAALSALAEVAPPSTPVLCVQNGVANEPTTLRRFANVYGVWVACPTSHLEPGVVRAWSAPVSGLLDVGRYPRGVDDLCEAVAADLRAASFGSRPVAEIRRWKYRKLLSNLGNAIEAVCGPGGEWGPLSERVRAEGEVALAAAGCEAATEEEDRVRRGDLIGLGQIGGETRPGGSSWQSAWRRTGDIETDYLNGEIVLLGRLHGVPTPANELLQRLAREVAARRLPPGSTPAATVWKQLPEYHPPAPLTAPPRFRHGRHG